MNKPEFKEATKDLLDQIGDHYYGGGRKLKEGDLIMYGYTMYYSTIGAPPSNYDNHNNTFNKEKEKNLLKRESVLNKNINFKFIIL